MRGIESRIHDAINYLPGFSNASTADQGVFVQRAGTGHDAKDVAFATIFGGVQMLRKELQVLEGDRMPLPPLLVEWL